MSPVRCGPGPSSATARKKVLFTRSKAVETHAEEILVETGNDFFGGALTMRQSDRAWSAPDSKTDSPTPEGNTVSLGQSEHFGKGGDSKGHFRPPAPDRGEPWRRHPLGKRSNVGEAE